MLEINKFYVTNIKLINTNAMPYFYHMRNIELKHVLKKYNKIEDIFNLVTSGNILYLLFLDVLNCGPLSIVIIPCVYDLINFHTCGVIYAASYKKISIMVIPNRSQIKNSCNSVKSHIILLRIMNPCTLLRLFFCNSPCLLFSRVK